jgi:hypothetical protein
MIDMRRFNIVLVAAALTATLASSAWALSARGTVFHDRDGDGVMGPREPGLPGVGVSNGDQVVVTDSSGHWELPCDDYTIFFVIKPSQWSVRTDQDGVQRGYYIHCPEGAPDLQYPGVAPTGPLPRSIDFALTPATEPERFEVICLGDPQPWNVWEVELLAQDLVEQLAVTETSAAFGMVLGDVVFDDLSLLPLVTATLGRAGIPWHYAMGNHDRNYDTGEEFSTTTWHRVVGPDHYAFNYGGVHFLVLENIAHQDGGGYSAGLTEEQLNFVREDLRHVPKDTLIVYIQHIPVMEQSDQHRFLRLFEGRQNVLGLSAHWHSQQHFFLNADFGWPNPMPHHHLVHVASCGAWWQGQPDHQGIPHANAPDGTPNGYSVIRFDGNRYEIQYRAARREASYQMRLWAPEEVEPGDGAFLYANVFGGSERSTVEYRLTRDATMPGEWTRMERRTDPDPADVEAIRARYRGIMGPDSPFEIEVPVWCAHLWHTVLAAPEEPGYYRIEVCTTDMFGNTHQGVRVLRVVAP